MTLDMERLPSRKGTLVAASTAMREVQKEAELAARLDLRVLISGEYGVGKRRLTRLIHAVGSRHRGHLYQIRCGQKPEAQLYSRLFGGGDGGEAKPGVFERADGGTILLQDVGA